MSGSGLRRWRLAERLPEPLSHYVDGVSAGGFLWVSGMLPVDRSGGLVGGADAGRQAAQVLANVGVVLEAAGATFADVVKVTVYLRRMADREVVNGERRRVFGEARPASTLVEVSALAHPDALVEIDAVAVCPPSSADPA